MTTVRLGRTELVAGKQSFGCLPIQRITKEEAETMILVTVMEDVGQVIILSMVAPMFAGGSMDPASLVIMIAMIVVFMLGSIFLGIRFVPRKNGRRRMPAPCFSTQDLSWACPQRAPAS